MHGARPRRTRRPLGHGGPPPSPGADIEVTHQLLDTDLIGAELGMTPQQVREALAYKPTRAEAEVLRRLERRIFFGGAA